MVRRLRFEWPEDLDPDWSPQQPELACVANAVSMLMPHVEPYVVRSVRAVLDDLDEPLRSEAATWVDQETAHHGAHARFNRILLARRPSLRRVDRWMATTYRWLDRRSGRFGLAYAAGAETVAFMVARWVDRRLSSLFRGADRTATTLFLWHLAEEVEHKSVAFDVHRARGGGRLSYAGGMVTTMVMMAWFTTLGTLFGLAANRRILHPGAHLRMLAWSLGFWFELGPAMAGAVVAGHHPSAMADPPFLPTWLRSYDPATRTMPEWSMDLVEATV
ncbi:MAG TPA: metal-dependent hydrolase [Iamia sp.]|nr:metal-dependent hydrolase [Iamia sp.]